jgi:hypothetical protein
LARPPRRPRRLRVALWVFASLARFAML